MKPIKGYIPKKIPEKKPELGSSIESVIRSVNELEDLKKDIIETVDAKIIEVETKSENADYRQCRTNFKYHS